MKHVGLSKHLLITGVIYYLLAIGCIFLSRQPGNIATLWFANAAAVIALQMRPMRSWPLSLATIGVAMLAANLSFDAPLLFSVSFIPGNLLEITLGAYMLNRYGKMEECLVNPSQLLKTLSLAAFLPSLVGAILGAAALAAYGQASFARVWPAWAIGSAIGSVSILPLGFMLLVRGLPSLRKRLGKPTTAPIMLLVIATALYVPLFLPFPFVYVSAALIFVAVIGRIDVLAIALPLTTLSLGILIALGLFLPPPSISEFGELAFYLPFFIATLPSLITAVVFEKVDQVNAKLTQSETSFRGLYNKTPVMMHSQDKAGHLVSVSDTWIARLGYSREEVLGRNSVDFLTYDSQCHARDVVFPQFEREGWIKDVDLQMVCRNKEIIDVRFSAIREVNSNEEDIRTLAVIVDVTEEKRLMAVLAEKKSRLDAILDGTAVGTWAWNVASGETTFNARWFEMLGYSPSDPEVTSATGWQSLVHPDDADLCKALLADHFGGKQSIFSQELRMRHRQGHWVYMLARGKVSTWTKQGMPQWMYGTHLDISEIKKSQKAAEEGQFFLERTGQIAGVGAWSVDLHDQCIIWSDQTCRIHGLPVGHRPSMEEALGYYTADSRLSIQAAIDKAISTHQGWDLELQIVTAQGVPIWVRAAGEVELDKGRNPTRLVGAFQDITVRKTSESELNRLNALLRNVLQSASEISIVATDLEGKIQIFNAGAERLLGYSAEEMVGKKSAAVLHVADEIVARAKALSKEFGEPIEGFRVFFHKLRLGQVEAQEWSYVRKDGSLVPVSLVVTEMRDERGKLNGFLGVATDISQKLADQRAIAAAAEQLNLAIEVADMGIWSWDLGTNQWHWNDRMYAFYDQPIELKFGGLRYEHWRTRLHPDDLVATEANLLNAVAGKGTYDPVFRVVRRDGSIRHIQAGARIERDSSGNAIKVIGFNRDITDQLLLESSLRHAKEQSDLASMSKSTFLANMSHEIRTPMNAVLGMLQLVKMTDLDARQEDYIIKAQIAAKSLLGLLNDILDFSKVEAGKLELDPHPFELEQLLRDLAVVLSGNLGNKNVELLFEIDPSLPRVLLADRLRLQQILINIAGNAIKFTQQGEVVVTFRRISSSFGAVTFQVAVRDSGIGISAEQLDRIFDGFSQAEASTTRRFGGTGLGLAISRRLVSLMGGALTVDSELGRGSVFTFELTLPVADESPLLQAKIPVKPVRILVVDDNSVARKVLSDQCLSLGCVVEAADSGPQAIRCVEQALLGGNAYDVILMDWRMPDMDGLQAAAQINAMPATRIRSVILMVNAYDHQALQETRALNKLPDMEVLTKPLTPVQLSEALSRSMLGEQAPRLQPADTSRLPRLAGLQLLVVEDNALNRQVAFELLVAEGAKVTLADGGLTGVEMACNDGFRFDLILMDVQMPDMDGLEATRRILQRRPQAAPPILAMTANASAADREACLAAGMREHVGKPIDMNELVPAIRAAVGFRAEQNEPIASSQSDDLERAFQAALKRFSGNDDLLASTLEAFPAEAHRLIDQAQKADSLKSLCTSLHTLKGIAATVGAEALAKRAAALEQDAKNGDCDAGRRDADKFDGLRQLLRLENDLLFAALNRHQASTKMDITRGGGALPLHAVTERLQAILPLLEGKRMVAIDMIELLVEESDAALGQALLPLASQIQQLDFGQASVTLRDLLVKWQGGDAKDQDTVGRFS